MKPVLPVLLKDGYKVDHRRQYPSDTLVVYSNFTPRKSRVPGVDSVVFFGLQYFVQEYLIDQFNDQFFNRPKADVMAEYDGVMASYLGPGVIDSTHIGDLHDLGYLPLIVKGLPEGTVVPCGIPVLTIKNTHHKFFWLTNMLETLLSNVLWMPSTSATTAFQYRKCFEHYAEKTGAPKAFVPWQGHDFSMRGLPGIEAACLSGGAHLLSFTGTDSVPSLVFLRDYYGANLATELVGGSVAATEHSVMCMGLEDCELNTIRRLITEVYPTGVISIVCDSWDYWRVITEYLPALKDEIMARDGKVVVRPDSGDPVKVICGDVSAKPFTPEWHGSIQCLWNTFGGTITDKGYKELDSHIGLIYGDSITLERQETILSKLAYFGFASSNVVLGVGSYTYQYVTRDTYGWAMKATWGLTERGPQDIFKMPKTDDGTKNSAKGLLCVDVASDGVMFLEQGVTEAREKEGALETVFLDGKLTRFETLAEIRDRLEAHL